MADQYQAIREALAELPRYEATLGGGCECCGTWVEYEADKNGSLVKWDELTAAVAAAIPPAAEVTA